MATVLIDQLAPVLEKFSLLSFGFRFYQRVSSLNPRVYLRNRSYRVSQKPDAIPIPPARLLMSVAGSSEISVFLDGGQRAAEGIREILHRNQIGIEDLHAILDFGCGCGRVLRFWKDLTGSELHGTDYNTELAAWCAQHLPFAQIGTNGLAPPTSYPASRFDLIYALSVFTHLPETSQMAWMDEFHRILRPGGFLLLSLHGAHYLSRLNEPERRQFLAGELVTRYDYSAGTNLCSVFHPETYVRKHMTGDFDVVDFIPEGARGNPRQDAWLFRRR
jgi:SAM-dependent methyltransferase